MTELERDDLAPLQPPVLVENGAPTGRATSTWRRPLDRMRSALVPQRGRIALALVVVSLVAVSTTVHCRSAMIRLEVKARQVTFRVPEPSWIGFDETKVIDLVVSGLTRVARPSGSVPAERLYTTALPQPTSLRGLSVPAGTTLSLRLYDGDTVEIVIDAGVGVELTLVSSGALSMGDDTQIPPAAPASAISSGEPLVLHLKLAKNQGSILDQGVPLEDPGFVTGHEHELEGGLVARYESSIHGGKLELPETASETRVLHEMERLRLRGAVGHLVAASLDQGALSLAIEATAREASIVRGGTTENLMPTLFAWFRQPRFAIPAGVFAALFAALAKLFFPGESKR